MSYIASLSFYHNYNTIYHKSLVEKTLVDEPDEVFIQRGIKVKQKHWKIKFWHHATAKSTNPKKPVRYKAGLKIARRSSS